MGWEYDPSRAAALVSSLWEPFLLLFFSRFLDLALSIISALADLKTEGNPEPVNLWDPEPRPPPTPGPPVPLGIAGEEDEKEFSFAFTGLSFL